MYKNNSLVLLLTTASLNSTLLISNYYQVKQKQNEKINLLKSENDLAQFKKYEKLKNRNDLFINLKQSLKLKNNWLTIKKEKLNKKIWMDLYNLILSKDYEQNLNWLYKWGMINFYESEIKFIAKSQARGLWIESYWYWFGYWKMHFENDLVQEYARILAVGGDVTGAISDSLTNHRLAIGAQIVSAVLSLGCFLWDKIPRLTIHFYLVATVFIQTW